MNLPDKVGLLGVGINPIHLQQAVDQIGAWISARDSQYVCVVPAHAIMAGYHQRALRQIFNHSGMTTPDGMAVVWLLRWLGYRRVSRVYGPDLLQAVCARSVRAGWRHYFYGGAPGVPEGLAARLRAAYPGIQIAGITSPPFRELTPAEDQQEIARINHAQVDVLWVGLGSPKQEYWMAAHQGKLDVPVMVGVGAAFDFVSGRKRQAPRWIQHLGFEWLFRLACEPRRLWRRYSEYPLFSLLVLGQLLGIVKG